MPAVGLSDGAIQRLAMHLVDVSAIVFTAERSHVSVPDELREKLARLLSVDDAGERGVLALQTHAGMQHDGHQKTRLATRESEVGDGLDAIFELHQNILEA